MSKSRPWATPTRGRAPSGSRSRRRVLIFCEDSKSSVYYFRSFRVDPVRIELKILGTGMNTDTLAEEAIRSLGDAAKRGEIYSEVWCVFDRDSFPTDRYMRAFALAATRNIKVAWANEAFELWYLLHFDYIDTALGRHSYEEKLADRGLNYDKADAAVYAKVIDRQPTAIRNAKRLERYWNERGTKCQALENPSTNLHELVEFLNELAELASAL